MNRRALLLGMATASASLSGCVGGAINNPENPQDDSSRVAYERCDNRIVRVSNLPEPARTEAETSIDHSHFETEDDPLLPELIRVDSAYLRHDETYYQVTVDERTSFTRIHLDESIPVFEESVTLENWIDDRITIEVEIHHEELDNIIFSEQLDLEPSERVTLNEEIAFPYGTYEATVVGESLPKSGWQHTWELDQRFESGYAYPLELDDHGLFADPIDRDSSVGPCSWNEDGEVSTGH